MSGDYSRIRFDPDADIASVWMQQGRVQLDSDWNEGMAALDRRLRAESVDTFGIHPEPGISGVAVVSPQTPDAFKIEVTGGNVTIGRGRMYVDGLLAENHGESRKEGDENKKKEFKEFDPLLAEQRGQFVVNYIQQPYFPVPPVPAFADNKPQLAYLEVWQREITYSQRPEIVEKAVGVDTTTRWQTVWQVRFLKDIGEVNCRTPDKDFIEWQALIRPSGARMTIKAEEVPSDLDPCELTPGDGYRGLENQLYRIEIHDGGAAGTATFKWSRDNASVASNVVKIVSNTDSTELELASLGRDAVLRFNSGDWVEVLDDRRELSGENGDPGKRHGVMGKITDINETNQTITIKPPLPTELILPSEDDNNLRTRHTRVRRWDQNGIVRDADNKEIIDLNEVSSKGLIPVPKEAGKSVVLENGIRVTFSLDPVGGEFRCGDYWVSAARTADARVEEFTDKPPRGIHRHYARLAIVSFNQDNTPEIKSDCRIHWPPACGGCCTISVAPGENIQAALDSLPDEGGCVCLKTGVHTVSEPIKIHSSKVILRGEGPGTIVQSTSSTTVLQVGIGKQLSDIVIEGIRFESIAEGECTILRADQCRGLRVEHCEMVGVESELSSHTGIYLSNVSEVNIAKNRLQKLIIGIKLENYSGRMDIYHNLIEGRSRPSEKLRQSLREKDIEGKISSWGWGIVVDSSEMRTAPCRINNNLINNCMVAVQLGNYAAGSVVANNRISRGAFLYKEKSPPTDKKTIIQYLNSRKYAIQVSAENCVICSNDIDLNSNLWGGISVIDKANHVIVVSNRLLSQFEQGNDWWVPASIYCSAADYARIHDNHLLGPQTGIIGSKITGATIKDNHLDGDGKTWYGVWLGNCNESCVQNNRIQNVFFAIHLDEGERNILRENHIRETSSGITSGSSLKEAVTTAVGGDVNANAGGTFNVEVSGNQLQSCTTQGIALLVNGTATLIGNHLKNCGYEKAPDFNNLKLSELLPLLGIGVWSQDLHSNKNALVRIESCEVIDTGISAEGKLIRNIEVLSITGLVSTLQLLNNCVDYSIPNRLDSEQENRAFLFIGPLGVEGQTITGSALVSGNHFRGFGKTALVEFRSQSPKHMYLFEKVIFSNNVCEHLDEKVEFKEGATVLLNGEHLVLMGNHIKGPRGINSMSLDANGNTQEALVLGNIATGNYNIQAANITPISFNDFNVKIS